MYFYNAAVFTFWGLNTRVWHLLFFHDLSLVHKAALLYSDVHGHLLFFLKKNDLFRVNTPGFKINFFPGMGMEVDESAWDCCYSTDAHLYETEKRFLFPKFPLEISPFVSDYKCLKFDFYCSYTLEIDVLQMDNKWITRH